jgi:dihydrofolate reductase
MRLASRSVRFFVCRLILRRFSLLANVYVRKEKRFMRKIIEYTLVSLDGVFENPASWGLMALRDAAYLRDGLGLLSACDAMLMGRHTYESMSKIWPGSPHPWAQRLNEIKKYVFSSKLERADWENSTIVRGDVAAGVAKIKEQEGRDLVVFGHGVFSETLLQQKLLDVLELSIHPLLVGHGKLFFREGQIAKMQLVATKTFSKIVKVTYEPQF